MEIPPFSKVLTTPVELAKTIKSKMKSNNINPYIKSRNIHASLVKLGLLSENNNSQVFFDYYVNVFKEMSKSDLRKLIEEKINVYREIFVDLIKEIGDDQSPFFEL